MNTIKTDYNNRCETIDSLYNHIIYMTDKPKSVNTVLILKSSLFVAMYNNIEATFHAIFEKIHECINSTDYKKLSKQLKGLFVDFHFSTLNHVTPESLRKLNDSELKFPFLNEYLNKKRIFSGNIDIKKANEVFRKYGIKPYTFDATISESLLLIKNKRNSIAHGELTLLEAGAGFTIAKIQSIISACNLAMAKFIELAGKFISNGDYMDKQTQQPT